MDIDKIRAELQMRKDLLAEIKSVNKELAKSISEPVIQEDSGDLLQSKPDAKVTVTSKITDLARELLQGGKKITSAQLLQEAENRNIEVSGKVPQTTIAAVLSRQKETFVSNKKEGWSLKSENVTTGNSDVLDLTNQ